MSIKINYQLAKIKTNALRLRGSYQLPSYLCYLILHLDNNSPVALVKYLMAQSDHMLRLKGYYKKYPSIEKQCNEIIKNELSKLKVD